MKEFNEQRKIVNISKKIEKLPNGEKGLSAYRALIYNRFFEVLSHAFPIFFEIVDKVAFEQGIDDFIRYGAKTPYIWQLPNEFRTFVKKQKVFKTMPYIHDLLWFEWIEIELMMQNYKGHHQIKFDFACEYKLSSSSAIRKIKYRVHEKKFTESGEVFLLTYYDFLEQEVYFREISHILYLFLKELKQHGIRKSIEKLSNDTNETKGKVKKFLKPTLEELSKLGVLTEKNKRK